MLRKGVGQRGLVSTTPVQLPTLAELQNEAYGLHIWRGYLKGYPFRLPTFYPLSEGQNNLNPEMVSSPNIMTLTYERVQLY